MHQKHTARHHRQDFLTLIDSLARKSNLSGIPPAVKTTFSLSMLLLCVWADDPVLSALCCLIPPALLILVGKTNSQDMCSLLLVPASFLLASCAAIAFTLSPHPVGIWHIPFFQSNLCMTYDGLTRAAQVFLKSCGAVCCLAFLSFTTTMDELIGLLRRLHMPALIIDLMFLIYRYIFLLWDTHRSMTLSAQARLGDCIQKARRRSFSTIAASLLACSYRRTSNCFDAMLSRCYDSGISFLTPQKESALPKAFGAMLLLLPAVLFFLVLMRKAGGWF